MQSEGLRQAKTVLAMVMRLKTSKLLFNEPVDAAALGLDDYHTKVKRPMDFGTIMGRLEVAQSCGWKKSHYQTLAQVQADVSLVFENCVAYNDGEQDAVTRDLAEEVRSSFLKRWAEAGLEEAEGRQAALLGAEIAPGEWQSEAAVPSTFSSGRGACDAGMSEQWARLPAPRKMKVWLRAMAAPAVVALFERQRSEVLWSALMAPRSPR